jgi:4-diphosphocytidyl-2-C-methyl-D-erythritol kinase
MHAETAARRVRVRAFAKLNVTLRVLGARADGYHDLRTTFQSLALHDTITFTPTRRPFTIDCDDPECPRDPSNLIWRAAAALWRDRGRGAALPGVHVRVVKRIPSRAGLGGGSSDAAAALRALARLWRLRVTDDQFRAIGGEIGADVPFFFEGGTALGLERGDLLYPLLDAPPSWVVLARPDFGVATSDAYAWWDAEPVRGEEGGNDLEAPVIARHPEIANLISRLRGAGATRAGMSGSGSAVFGLFDRQATARVAARRVAGSRITTWITRTLDRASYRRGTALKCG